MRVDIGNYRHPISTHSIARWLLFWRSEKIDGEGIPVTDPMIDALSNWLRYGSTKRASDARLTWFARFLSRIQSTQRQVVDVDIAPYDTADMATTLGHIIRPMLRQLRDQKAGAPFVDFSDVPSTLIPKTEPELGDTDDTHFDRWEYITTEMMFAFESLPGGSNEHWEAQFMKSLYAADGDKVAIDDCGDVDFEGRASYQSRIENGFRLFGKYYQCLWS